ncbi:MAG TPA: hypothetical protein VJU15_06840 [Gemmatimonadales bacterium]|nr:hypothetical protein [Gemmatimonadales bacterium]
MTAPAAPSARARVLLGSVRDAGLVPELTSAGGVLFKFEGKNYLIPDDRDEPFIRIIHQEVRKIRDEKDRALLETVAVGVSTTTKVAKVYVGGDQVWAAVELYCWPVERFRPVLIRSLTVLDYAVVTFTAMLKAHEAAK